MCPAFPGSEYISKSDFTLQRLPFSGMFHIVRHTPLGPHRAKTAVDLSGSLTLPSLNVPCSLTPPQSPATIALYGDLLLPSSHYDAVGLRFLTFTRLNRFTFVTARSSLAPTLNPCRCLHEFRFDSRWGGSFPFPRREFHPLKASGLA